MKHDDSHDTDQEIDMSQTFTVQPSTATTGNKYTVTAPDPINIQTRTATNVGTAAAGSTAVENGNGFNQVTVLTVSTTLGAIAGGADLGLGKLIYTFPAGEILVTGSSLSIALTAADGNIDADTPEVGLGTVEGTGAVAVLGGTATFEDISIGTAMADCSGTAKVVTTSPTAGTPLAIAAASAHTVYLNFADGWAASGETACPVAGTIYLFWNYAG